MIQSKQAVSQSILQTLALIVNSCLNLEIMFLTFWFYEDIYEYIESIYISGSAVEYGHIG